MLVVYITKATGDGNEQFVAPTSLRILGRGEMKIIANRLRRGFGQVRSCANWNIYILALVLQPYIHSVWVSSHLFAMCCVAGIHIL